VADPGNHRVQKFTKDGDFITKWDTIPWAIAADSLGYVYITDTSNHFVEKFLLMAYLSKSGAVLAQAMGNSTIQKLLQ
jgi:NHL repeat